MNLVTGGTGLVGTHLLVELAARGEAIRCLKRPQSDLNTVKKIFQHYRPDDGLALFSGIEWIDGDLLDIHSLEEAMKGADQVFHCAAIVSFDPSKREQLLKFNAEGTANVVNLCLDNGIQKLCHVSSTAAIGMNKAGGCVHEDLQWKKEKGISGYSISKHNAEREVWRGHIEGLETVIVNPSVILGPGNWEKSSLSIFQQVYNGLPFYTEGANGFVDARDVAGAMVRLMDSNISGERFLIVGENRPFREVFEMIAKELQATPPSKKAEKWMTSIGWRAEKLKSLLSGKPPRITKETVQSAHKQIHYSNEKVKEQLDFEFTPLEETIKNACTFFRANHLSAPNNHHPID